MRLVLLFLALLFAGPATAQEPEWRAANEYDVLLRPYAYEPGPIRLAAGRPVKLRFLNPGRATYSFAADDFFRSARIRPGDSELVQDGEVRLGPGEQRVVALVPAAGRYRARSRNFLHRLLGMSTEIIVE